MKIIDPHVHIGHDTTFESNRVEDEMIRVMDQVGIHAVIVQPAQFLTFVEYHYGHKRIRDFSLKHPKRVFGMASMNPHFDPDLYRQEIRQCVIEYNFVGVKLTPLTHVMDASVKRARLPFEMARELNVPLMIHQGIGLPFSYASSYFDLISEFSDVTIVLAHSGTMDNAYEDIILAKELPNVYLECSARSTNQKNITLFVNEIGAHRVMYASDSPDEMDHIVWEFKNCGFSTEQLEWCLWKSAATAFKLSEKI